jgi:amidase
MNRRNFLTNSTIVSVALPAIIASSCNTTNRQNDSLEPSEIYTDDFELNEITIDELQQKMTSGGLTSVLITKMYLQRIEKIDKNGVTLNAIIELNPDALFIAGLMDNDRKLGKLRGPLHGIPVLIKDNIDTADKMMTTAGSIALEGHKAAKDAFIIKKLRESGAVLLGKTNLSEWANFRSTRSSSGWSSRGGQTKNPYLLNRSPCGSSSGSGVAVSANLCTIAIGTETNGSIACPSSVNGIVGIKPTVGLLSRAGIIPISTTQDTAGPIARTVKDAAILLGILAGRDNGDEITFNSDNKTYKDYTQFLHADGLKGKRIGIEKSFLKVHEGVDIILHKALEQMKEKGATIVEIELMKTISGIDPLEQIVLEYEFKDGINKYLSKAGAKVKSLKELIEFNKKNEDKAMPFFKQEIFESAEKRDGLDSKEYTEALNKLLSTVRKGINTLLSDQKLVAICGPSNGPSWCIDVINGDAFTGYGMYSPAAIAGYPSITVPMGSVNQLPIGISFFGMPFSEPELISIAFAYEKISQNRKMPKYMKSIL